MKITYKDAGVDISEGNKSVDLIKEKVKGTYINGVVGDLGLFAGGFSIKEYKDMEDPILVASTDGVGTKLMVAQEADKHDTIGIDLVAMCVNDLICMGAKPLFFLDYIASGKIKAEKIAEIVGSIADGCKESGCALIGGETAEMPGLYAPEDYDLGGFSVGIIDRSKIIDGKKIQSGDVVVGLLSSGLHSNGYSLARKIFFDHLKLKADEKYKSDKKIGELMLEPTKIYVKTVLDVIERFDIRGIANITGGGLIENVPRIFAKNISCEIDPGTWKSPEIFEIIQDLDIVEKDELYRSFNMGIGMVFVVSERDAGALVDYINESTEDDAVVIGRIVEGDFGCRIL